ncbi:MAG: class I SAM-dependent methyltransferase [Pelolinea sp.]|nr:class I SAM-dependent methyltransferase [Pelolinea sp.]
MPTEKEVYDAHADQYERLILREDTENNLPKEIKKIRDIHGSTIVEFGAGTGRLTRFLAKEAAYIAASDLSHHMLSQAKGILEKQHTLTTGICVADMRNSPYASHSADLIIAGWSFCYLAVWGGDHWKEELERGLKEAQRLLRPGGEMILFENFGTGFETPNPPPHLSDYFEFLKENGFQATWFRTDYQFDGLEEAVELSSFFFGDELSNKVKNNDWTLLPECTGMFWKTF